LDTNIRATLDLFIFLQHVSTNETMLRHLKNQLNGRADSLPSNLHNRPLDGSARSIDTVPQIQKTWQRTSVATRTTWICLLTSLWMVWYGWRWVRYRSGGITIDCHSVTCELKIEPLGWAKPVRILNLPRHQIVATMGVKTTKDGTFVTDQNVVLHEPFIPGRGQSKDYNKKSSYKGPDADGYYISYGIVLQDKKSVNDHHSEGGNIMNDSDDVDLQALVPYADPYERTVHEQEEQQQQQPSTIKYYRLIPRQFGVRESKRRVRTMVTKLDGYIQRRRQKLIVREFAPPAWQGVVMMVVGSMTFFVALALGQCTDPVVPGGTNGVRRQRRTTNTASQKSHYTQGRPSAVGGAPPKRNVVQDVYQVSTPSQYEVRTNSAAAASSSSNSRPSTGMPSGQATSSYRRSNAKPRPSQF
jgi:hypothetical protein